MNRTLLVAFVGLLVAACPGEEESPADDDAGGAGAGGSPPQFATSECGSCVQQTCAAQILTCNADPGCAAYLECLLACPPSDSGDVDAPCEAACPVADSSVTIAQVEKLRFCRQSGQGAIQCPTCGYAPAIHPCLEQSCQPSTEVDACLKCLDESCCESRQACSNNTACGDLAICISQCGGDATCAFGCYPQHPDGAVDLSVQGTCLGVHCLDACLPSADACGACGYNRCAYQRIECDKDRECALLSGCVTGCQSGLQPDILMCLSQCEPQNPAGSEKFHDYLACVNVECVEECPYAI